MISAAQKITAYISKYNLRFRIALQLSIWHVIILFKLLSLDLKIRTAIIVALVCQVEGRQSARKGVNDC